jgi:chemotaxis protein histidine kinase CheA
VDRLLNDPRHGERWARHWMDIWRYSDWAGWSGGNQIRDSQPHIWRWRDWIIESLNEDKGYDRMLVEMLAADELAPEAPETLRATGFLVRNYKMLSREQWLEDTINHTSRAFLGVTMHCAKCHDHRSDPISQTEYFQMRAIFEPHKVRIDHVPGETDTRKAGLARAYDAELDPPTWLFHRGDERRPETNQVITAAVPRILGGSFSIEPVSLPPSAWSPEKRAFVIQDQISESEKKVAKARSELEQTNSPEAPSRKQLEADSALALAEARHAALLAVIRAEALEEHKETEEGKSAAREALAAQRKASLREAAHKLLQAQHAKAALDEKTAAADLDAAAKEKLEKEIQAAVKKLAESEADFAKAEKELENELTTAYTPRSIQTYPSASTGRRLAFARWLASTNHPLTARVAVNHIWLRHFGQALVPTVDDFGAGGREPSHPELLDWLSAELMAQDWRMRPIHRLIVTSAAYRMASTPDEDNLRIDPDNVHLWRMPSRRMEAELVRDNILFASGQLDPAMGGPEIDHTLGLTSKRRSVYLRIAAEKEVEFLKIFDGPSVAECYERKPSVLPHQALAMANSELTRSHAKALARSLSQREEKAFVLEAFDRILARAPTPQEERLCLEFLTHRSGAPDVANQEQAAAAREHLVLVLFSHNDFVTIR